MEVVHKNNMNSDMFVVMSDNGRKESSLQWPLFYNKLEHSVTFYLRMYKLSIVLGSCKDARREQDM